MYIRFKLQIHRRKAATAIHKVRSRTLLGDVDGYKFDVLIVFHTIARSLSAVLCIDVSVCTTK